MPPTLAPAVRLALRALRREAWLVAAGLAVAGLRRLLGLPAFAVGWALVVRGALAGAGDPLSLGGPLGGALAVVTSPRFVGLVGGLWLAGAVAGALLRLVFVSGAAPVLAGAMAGAPTGSAGFVSGAAHGLLRVLATAALGFVAELSAAMFSLTLGLAAIPLVVRAAGRGSAPLLAAAVALALTFAVAVPIAISVAVDAAVARAAVAGDGPAAAFAEAARRLLLRPGAFLLGAIAFGAVRAFGPAAIEGLGQALHAPGAPPIAVVGPMLVVGALALAAVAAIDLAWLGTVSALACAEEGSRRPAAG